MAKVAPARLTDNLCPACGKWYDDLTDSRECPHNNAWTGEKSTASPNTPHGEAGKAGEAGETPPLMGFDGVAMDGVSWLWPGWLARGKLTTLAGPGGAGKGTLAAHLVAAATGGRTWPDRTKTDPCPAVVVSPDDGLADTLKPRLHHSGADIDLCHHVPAAVVAEGVPAIMACIRSADVTPGLVVFDVIQAGMSADTDGNSANAVARHVNEFSRLAEDINCSFLLIHHTNKRLKTKLAEGSLSDVVRGSGVWTDASRMVLLLVPDENDPDGGRVMVRAKCNLPAVRWYQGGYSVKSRDVEFEGDNGLPGQVTVVGAMHIIDGKATDIFTEAVTKADDGDKVITRHDTATDALAAFLQPGKPVLKQTAVAALSSQGHAPRTIERVALHLAHEERIIIRKPNKGEFPDANRNAAVWEAM